MNWRDHLLTGAEAANLLTVAAEKIRDDEIKTALLTTARVIDGHIRKGIRKAEAEMDGLVPDPINPPFSSISD